MTKGTIWNKEDTSQVCLQALHTSVLQRVDTRKTLDVSFVDADPYHSHKRPANGSTMSRTMHCVLTKHKPAAVTLLTSCRMLYAMLYILILALGHLGHGAVCCIPARLIFHTSCNYC